VSDAKIRYSRIVVSSGAGLERRQESLAFAPVVGMKFRYAESCAKIFTPCPSLLEKSAQRRPGDAHRVSRFRLCRSAAVFRIGPTEESARAISRAERRSAIVRLKRETPPKKEMFVSHPRRRAKAPSVVGWLISETNMFCVILHALLLFWKPFETAALNRWVRE
jgi:hypothetical protein